MAPLTTAQALAQYYRELTEGGIPRETAHELVLEAGRELLNVEDLVVLGSASGEPLRLSVEPSEGVGESESPA
ncbi:MULTISPECIES: hypothetical protein [Streptomyces]|uniref:hypothetical protein n=1 Tax=Streptomyces lycopersici TaxID=2974589 RepID=UPI0021CEBF58|nr:hypothetical protein [Streptomyces sp. NEAU-383]